MTALLEQAIREVSKLPEQEQERIAAWLLEELASEQHWDELFSRSPVALARLADEAIGELRSSRTEVLDPDSL